MQKIAVMTDSNCGILPDEGKKLGISIVPMPVIIDGTTYYEGVDITAEEFYKRQAAGAEITSSLPSPGDVMDMWEALLKEHDEVVYIPMTSGLSTSCHSAVMLAEEYDGRVHVVDNKRISVTQMQSVFDACKMAEQGMTGSQIKQRLEEEALDATIYIAVDTLEYLKKGGRITPAAAALGTMLRLKPVLQIHGEKLDAFSKVRTMSAAKKTMIDAIRNDLENRFAGSPMKLAIAHTNNEAMALEFKAELEKEFPGYPEIIVNELSLSVACHIGDGALAVACSRIPEV